MEYRSPDVVVTDRAVFFDGLELPWYIAENGISFKPGGSDDLNTLTVEFIVDSTTFLGIDPMAPWLITVGWPNLELTIELDFCWEHMEFDRILKEYL